MERKVARVRCSALHPPSTADKCHYIVRMVGVLLVSSTFVLYERWRATSFTVCAIDNHENGIHENEFPFALGFEGRLERHVEMMALSRVLRWSRLTKLRHLSSFYSRVCSLTITAVFLKTLTNSMIFIMYS